jgi:hypothetical protein
MLYDLVIILSGHHQGLSSYMHRQKANSPLPRESSLLSHISNRIRLVIGIYIRFPIMHDGSYYPATQNLYILLYPFLRYPKLAPKVRPTSSMFAIYHKPFRQYTAVSDSLSFLPQNRVAPHTF